MPLKSMRELWSEPIEHVESVMITPSISKIIILPYNSKKETGLPWSKLFQDAVRKEIFKIGRYIPTEPTKIELIFYLPHSIVIPPDVDNLAKEILDIIFGFEKDNRITTLIAKKRKGIPAVGINIEKDDLQ